MENYDDIALEMLLQESADKPTPRTNNVGSSTAIPDVNKTFLANTILHVVSHNRKEQIDACWRQHTLQKRLDKGSEGERSATKSIQDFENERIFWAMKKQKSMAERSAPTVTLDDESDSGSASRSSSSSSSSSSSYKKKKRKKMKKVKKKVKKSKKHKKYKRNKEE